MYKMNNKQVVKHHRMSQEPWLYDESLSDEERMIWKLKGKCHICRYDVKHHKDDCPFSDVQLSFASIERELERTSSLEHLDPEELAEYFNTREQEY